MPLPLLESIIIEFPANIESTGKSITLCFIGHQFVAIRFQHWLGSRFANYTWSMENNQELSHGRHCVFAMHVNLVFVTKSLPRVRCCRHPDAKRDLQQGLYRLCINLAGNGRANHVHLLIQYPPKVSVSSLVNSLKGVSSRMLRQQRTGLRKRHWKGVLWSPSYFAASCGGAPIDILKRYIEQQRTPT